MTTNTIRPGDVATYTPDDKPMDRWWCKEGTAIAVQRGDEVWLCDTFWQSDPRPITPTEAETAVVQFNVEDYEEIRGKDAWEKYAPADRQVVTSQHRLQASWLVRKGATEDLPTQIENARERVREAESAVRSAENALDWERRQLAELEAKATVDA